MALFNHTHHAAPITLVCNPNNKRCKIITQQSTTQYDQTSIRCNVFQSTPHTRTSYYYVSCWCHSSNSTHTIRSNRSLCMENCVVMFSSNVVILWHTTATLTYRCMTRYKQFAVQYIYLYIFKQTSVSAVPNFVSVFVSVVVALLLSPTNEYVLCIEQIHVHDAHTCAMSCFWFYCKAYRANNSTRRTPYTTQCNIYYLYTHILHE